MKIGRWGVAGALISSLLFSGCTTLNTSADTAYGAQPEGLAYFLPMRLVKLTARKERIDLADLISKRDKKVVELAGLKAKAEAAARKLEQAETALAALAANAAAQARTDATRNVEAAKKDKEDADAAVPLVEQTVTTLHGLIVSARHTGATCRYLPQIEPLNVQGDRRMRFLLSPRHSEWRDDHLELAVGANGLLNNVKAVSVDQTGAAIVQLAGVAGLVAGLDLRGFAAPETPQAAAAGGCEGPLEIVQIFDPTDESAVLAVNRALLASKFPLTVAPSVEGPALSRNAGSDSYMPASGVRAPGLYYRTAAPLLLTIRELPHSVVGARQGAGAATPADGVSILGVLLTLPQAGPVSFLPYRASPFVETVNDVRIADGAVTSWTTDRPSAILAFASIPGQALDAFATAFSKAVAVRIDIRNQSGTLAQGRTDDFAREVRGQVMVNCVARATTDVERLACLPKEAE